MTAREVLAVVGQYGADVTEEAAVEDLSYDVEPGQEEGPQRLGAEQAAFAGQSGDLGGLGGVERERLLHQRVLARRERDPGAVEVGGVLGGDVDDVDVHRRGQLLVGAVRVRDAVVVGELPGASGVARRDGREVLPRVAADGGHEAFGDPAGAHDAPAQYGRLHRVRGARDGQGRGEGAHLDLRDLDGDAAAPFFMDVMTASATALATRPSSAVARADGSPEAIASIQACSSRR